MNRPAATQTHQQKPAATPAVSGVLQRTCACGNHTIAGGECAECGKKKRFNLQTKLKVNKPGDIYEQEADRIADQVMAAPTVGGASPRIQCFSGHSNGQMDAAPASVDRVLASPGRPLEPALWQDIGQRFGHDFARVRVHADAAAEQSARDVNALAYTVGKHIVFGAGQYAPGCSDGQRLLAHELTHVVQQNNGLHGGVGGAPTISRAPVRLMSRKEEPKKEAPKKAALRKHTEQQRKVAGFLDNARKIRPDPKKDFRDPDNLFYNTVELLDKGKLTLTVLSPTHSNPNLHFDTRVRFDAKGNHFGGDYPDVPINGLEGVVENKESAFGQVNLPTPPPSTPTIQTLPPKVERAPGETAPAPEKTKPATTPSPPQAPTPFAPDDIYYFTRGLDITEAQFKNTFVHEGQHIADLSPKKKVATSVTDILEAYKSEFRAFWIQPPLPREGERAQQSIDRLPEPKGKADNSRKVTISKPDDCKICKPSTASTPAEAKTDLQNPRQEVIFRHIISNYPTQQYDCCYVYDEKFREAVNAFAYPESINLINSDRLMNLNLEVQKLNKAMTLAQVNSSNLVALLTQLDVLDWKFLDNSKLSKPFWDALKSAAPEFVFKGVNALIKKGTKKPVSATEVNKALSGK